MIFSRRCEIPLTPSSWLGRPPFHLAPISHAGDGRVSSLLFVIAHSMLLQVASLDNRGGINIWSIVEIAQNAKAGISESDLGLCD